MTRLTAEQRRDRALTEAEFLAQVIDLARLLGWRTAHFRPAWTGRGWRTPVQGDGAGFPDLLLVRRDRIVAAELKRETARPTPEQLAWLMALADAGVETHAWRPSNFDALAEALR